MIDETNIESISSELDISVAPVEEKKPRGNPNWRKKPDDVSQVKRADVISEFIVTDMWDVLHKDPKMHYVWGRKSSDEEMNRMIQSGYIPARGKERIMKNPLEAGQDGDGDMKERGDRILMMCPKDRVQARRLERASRYVGVEKGASAEARAMQRKGVTVESVSSSETKRESFRE